MEDILQKILKEATTGKHASISVKAHKAIGKFKFQKQKLTRLYFIFENENMFNNINYLLTKISDEAQKHSCAIVCF